MPYVYAPLFIRSFTMIYHCFTEKFRSPSSSSVQVVIVVVTVTVTQFGQSIAYILLLSLRINESHIVIGTVQPKGHAVFNSEVPRTCRLFIYCTLKDNKQIIIDPGWKHACRFKNIGLTYLKINELSGPC